MRWPVLVEQSRPAVPKDEAFGSMNQNDFLVLNDPDL